MTTTPTPADLRPKTSMNEISLKPKKYMRKPFYVDAVRITEENLPAIAAWCKGKVEEDHNGREYVLVDVLRPLNDRQTKGYLGDWILHSATGFKVYTPAAFNNAFENIK